MQKAIEELADALVIRERIAEVAPSIEHSTDRARACWQLAVLRLHRGQYRAALDACSRATTDLERGLNKGEDRLLPEWGKSKYAEAMVLRTQGREEEARRCIAEVLNCRVANAPAEWKNVVAMANDFLREAPVP